jgi:tetratricopeptide (TPR) repeat protein
LCILLALKWLKNPAGNVSKELKDEISSSMSRQDANDVIEEKEKKNQVRSRNIVLLIVYLLSLGIGFHLGTILVYGGILLLLLMVKDKSFTNSELLIFTFGVAVLVADMTIHKSSMATVVGLIIFGVLVVWSSFSEGKFAALATLLFILGISVHLFLLIRSAHNPSIDEVDPETWKSLYAHLRREQYPPINIFERKASLLFQFKYFWDYFIGQFRMLGRHMIGIFDVGRAAVAIPMVLGLYGMVSNYQRHRKTWVMIFVSFLLNSLGLIIFLNFSDSEVRERDYFYTGAFYFYAIFIGIGASAFMMSLVERAQEKGKQYSGRVVSLGLILLVCSLLPANHFWFSHDRSENYIPRDYAFNMLADLEPDAIIFTNGDNDTFPLWYIQYVESFRKDVRVANLSLLNTDWYIKQLRDEEPSLPITLNNREIDNLRPIARRDGSVIWTRDRAVMHIIQETNWSRPIYFGVTVPREVWKPYEQYLEMRGMSRKLVPRKEEFMVNEFMIARNFDHIYKFRGVITEDGKRDNSVYKDEDTRGMFVNFAIASFHLGQKLAARGEYREAAERLNMSLKLAPNFKWANVYLGTYYSLIGEPLKGIQHYRECIARNPGEGDYWLRLASIYESQGEMDAALQNLVEGSRLDPDNKHLYKFGVRMAAVLGREQIASDFVDRWLKRHPGDSEFRAIRSNMDSLSKVLLEKWEESIKKEGE